MWDSRRCQCDGRCGGHAEPCRLPFDVAVVRVGARWRLHDGRTDGLASGERVRVYRYRIATIADDVGTHHEAYCSRCFGLAQVAGTIGHPRYRGRLAQARLKLDGGA